MKMNIIQYEPIGTIHSPFKSIEGMPIQPSVAEGVKGTLEIKEEFEEGLKDLEGFSHIILIYHFHLSKEYSLSVIPFLDTVIHGVFATRAPKRPNPIGLSAVMLERIVGCTLHISNVDILDGTPLLDIKPYVPDFDKCNEIQIGWLTNNTNNILGKKSDKRFK